MIVEIRRNSSPEKVKALLRKTSRKKKSTGKKSTKSFFGKLPEIEDGLKYQKKLRNEWK